MQTKLTQFFKKNTLDKSTTDFQKNQTNIEQNNNIQKKTITIYTDGACKNNGKKNAIAGIGVYSENIYNISEKIEGRQTNQRAELYAILKALELTKIDDYSIVYIYTDSLYSINCITKWIYGWINNGWLDKKKKPVKNKDIIQPIYNIYKKYSNIRFIHIEAHTNKTDIHSLGNAKADELATLFNSAINKVV
jgi:ribonuclease HI